MSVSNTFSAVRGLAISALCVTSSVLSSTQADAATMATWNFTGQNDATVSVANVTASFNLDAPLDVSTAATAQAFSSLENASVMLGSTVYEVTTSSVTVNNVDGFGRDSMRITLGGFNQMVSGNNNHITGFSVLYRGTDFNVYPVPTLFNGFSAIQNGSFSAVDVDFQVGPGVTQNGREFSTSVAVTGAPEPSSTLLLGVGGMALLMRRKRSAEGTSTAEIVPTAEAPEPKAA